MEESLKEVWTKRAEQSRLQREARNRLMEEVMEARSLQIQHKRKKSRRWTTDDIHRSLVFHMKLQHHTKVSACVLQWTRTYRNKWSYPKKKTSWTK